MGESVLFKEITRCQVLGVELPPDTESSLQTEQNNGKNKQTNMNMFQLNLGLYQSS